MPKKSHPSLPSPTMMLTIQATDRFNRNILITLSTGSAKRRKPRPPCDTSSWESMALRLSAPITTSPCSTSRHKMLSQPSIRYGEIMASRVASYKQALLRQNPRLISPDTALKKWDAMMSDFRDDTLNTTDEVNLRLSARKASTPYWTPCKLAPARPPWLTRAQYLQRFGLTVPHIPYPTIGANISLRKQGFRPMSARNHGKWIFRHF